MDGRDADCPPSENGHRLSTIFTLGRAGQNLEGVVPDEVQWKSHNYSHLMEQPTIFYAIVLTLALMDMDAAINVYLAWGYVGLPDAPQPDPVHVEHRANTASRCSGWHRSACSG